MVELSSARVDRIFHALSDRTRRQMLEALVQGEASVSALAGPHSMSLAAISKHVKVLAAAELIAVEKRGRSRMCSLQANAFKDAGAIIAHYERFWETRLDALGQHLDAEARRSTDEQDGPPRHDTEDERK